MQKNDPVQLAEKRRVPTDKKTTQIRWQSGGAKYTIKLFKKQIQILKLFLPHSPGPLHPIFKLNLWILNNASHCQLASTPTFSLRNEILGFPYITWEMLVTLNLGIKQRALKLEKIIWGGNWPKKKNCQTFLLCPLLQVAKCCRLQPQAIVAKISSEDHHKPQHQH